MREITLAIWEIFSFRQNTDLLMSLTGFYQYQLLQRYSCPTGNHRSKLDFFLPLEVDKHIKGLYIGTQLGYTIHRKDGEENELFYGFFSEYPVGERIDVMGRGFWFLYKAYKDRFSAIQRWLQI